MNIKDTLLAWAEQHNVKKHDTNVGSGMTCQENQSKIAKSMAATEERSKSNKHVLSLSKTKENNNGKACASILHTTLKTKPKS